RIGRDEGLRRITAEILPENSGMQRVAEKLGFRLRHDFEEEVVKAEIDLRG
ncbi:MAG: GNAT family N-acetyltransferase, partial [Chloroflexota bacterium]|nr:GNAT family N-acetyltransferase [Chloroflexota bacterium]